MDGGPMFGWVLVAWKKRWNCSVIQNTHAAGPFVMGAIRLGSSITTPTHSSRRTCMESMKGWRGPNKVARAMYDVQMWMPTLDVEFGSTRFCQPCMARMSEYCKV